MDKHPDLDIKIVALSGVFNLCWREAYMVIEFSAPTARGLTTQRVSDYKLHFTASDDYLTKALPLTQTSEIRHHRIFGYTRTKRPASPTHETDRGQCRFAVFLNPFY